MKKTFNKICTVLGVIALVFLADACLKDSRVDFGSVSNTVEFLSSVPGRATAYNYADPSSTTPEVLNLIVNQTGVNATSEDITVTVAVSQRGLDMYNSDVNHQIGVPLPDSAYDFQETTTIIHGKDSINNDNRAAIIELTLYPNKTPGTLGVNYVISLEIVSAKTASGKDVIMSANRGIINFNFFHNLYDGDYHSVGKRFNFTTPDGYTGWDSVTQAPLATSTLSGAPATWDYAHAPVLTVDSETSSLHAANDPSGFGTINIVVNNDNVSTFNGPASTVTVFSNCPAYDGINNRCGPPQTDLGNLVQLPKVTGYYYAASKTFDIYYQYQNGAVAPATIGTFPGSSRPFGEELITQTLKEKSHE